MRPQVIPTIVGCVCLVGAAVLALQTGPADVGTVELSARQVPATPSHLDTPGATDATDASPAARSSTPTPGRVTRTSTPPVATPSATAPSSPRDRPRVATHSARLDDLRREWSPVPTQVTMPRLGLSVPVAPVGVDVDGRMAIPEDVGQAGWYRHGPAPGDEGNTVIAGHVDSRTQGLGAFSQLLDLEVGDVVEVGLADGTTTSWTIAGRETIDKLEVVPRELFSRQGPSQLVLVTCGGEFDGSERSYESNVIVVAQPL